MNVVPRYVLSIHSPLLNILRCLAAITHVIVVVMGSLNLRGSLNTRHYELIILRLLPPRGWRRRRPRDHLSAWKCAALEVVSEQVSVTLGNMEMGSDSMRQ